LNKENIKSIENVENVENVENGQNELSRDFRKSLLFVKVNRKEEDQDVIDFQRTQDMKILTRIYNRRVPSLQIWARKYAYLENNFDDMFEELTFHCIKAINGFNHKLGSFNTFLFSTLIYCIRNKKSRGNAQKRRPYGVEVNETSNFLLSLDYNYSSNGDADLTFKDTLPAPDTKTKDDHRLLETINILANGDDNLKWFLNGLSEGGSISSLMRNMKTKQGRIKLNNIQTKKINPKRRCNKVISDIIKYEKKIVDDFNLVDYQVINADKLHYTIEMKKTQESDSVMKSIRKFRKQKVKILETLY